MQCNIFRRKEFSDVTLACKDDNDIDATNEFDIIFNEKTCKKFKSDYEVQISAESIAEEFKYDDEVNISTESKDAEATEEVYIFLENRTNFDCELLGS